MKPADKVAHNAVRSSTKMLNKPPDIEQVISRAFELYVELLLAIMTTVNQIVLGTDWLSSILPGAVTNQEARDAAWKKFLTSP